jgi:hypothetical protein
VIASKVRDREYGVERDTRVVSGTFASEPTIPPPLEVADCLLPTELRVPT